MHVRSILEAILFVAEEPLDVGDLAEVVEQSRADVERELEGLAADLHDAGRGIVLRRIAGGWRLYSAPEARSHLERFARSESAARFSRAALEALAAEYVDNEGRSLSLEVFEMGDLAGTEQLFLEKTGGSGEPVAIGDEAAVESYYMNARVDRYLITITWFESDEATTTGMLELAEAVATALGGQQ